MHSHLFIQKDMPSDLVSLINRHGIYLKDAANPVNNIKPSPVFHLHSSGLYYAVSVENKSNLNHSYTLETIRSYIETSHPDLIYVHIADFDEDGVGYVYYNLGSGSEGPHYLDEGGSNVLYPIAVRSDLSRLLVNSHDESSLRNGLSKYITSIHDRESLINSSLLSTFESTLKTIHDKDQSEAEKTLRVKEILSDLEKGVMTQYEAFVQIDSLNKNGGDL